MWATGGLLPKGYPLIVGDLGPECFIPFDPGLIVAGTLAVGTIRVDQLISHSIIKTDHLNNCIHITNTNE
jgi:hypothetical protein